MSEKQRNREDREREREERGQRKREKCKVTKRIIVYRTVPGSDLSCCTAPVTRGNPSVIKQKHRTREIARENLYLREF